MELVNEIKSLGLGPILTTLLTILVFFYFKFKESINLFISNKLIIKRKRDFKISDLENHDLFNTLYRVKNEVKVEKFYTDGEFDSVKTKMCQDFVNFKVDVCAKRFRDLLKDDCENLTQDQLKTYILKSMNSMHDEYIEEIKKHWLDRDIKVDDVNYVIDLFERFRSDVIQSFHHRIDAIFAASFYNTNFKRLTASYDMFAMGIDLLPKDLKITFEALNGKFKKIKY